MSDNNTCCQNHVCKAALDPATETIVACPLCRKATYCSEQCRLTDWVKHACPNAQIASSAVDTPVVPYYFEDEEPEEAVAEEMAEAGEQHPFLEAHSVTHYNDTGNVSHSVTDPLVELVGADVAVKRESLGGSAKRGIAPSQDLAERRYRIHIQELDERERVRTELWIDGDTLGTDAIYWENGDDRIRKLMGREKGEDFRSRLRGAGRWLVTRLSKEGNRIILWPDMSAGTENHGRASNQPLGSKGTIIIMLHVDQPDGSMQRVGELRGPFNFRLDSFTLKLSRAFRKRLTQRLRAKFSGTNEESIKTMRTYRMQADDMRAVFTVQPEGDRVYIRDIEFSISPNRLYAAPTAFGAEQQLQYSIDTEPASLAAATGLLMALEKRAAEKGEKRHETAILRDYVRDLNDKRGGEIDHRDVPDAVHTAMYTATGALIAENACH